MKRLTAWQVGFVQTKCILIHQTDKSALRNKKCVQFLKNGRAVRLQRSRGSSNAQCVLGSQYSTAGEGD